MLEHLYYSGVDVTAQVRAGMFTAPALVGDNTLEAVFADAPPGTWPIIITDGDGK